MEYSYELKVPKDRVAVIIGTKGKIKRLIETEARVSLDIDSKEGEVRIYGEDGLDLFTARNIVQAIGRGFNPEIALNLLKPDYIVEIIDISNYSGKAKNKMSRLKGRVIGEEGRSRKHIEAMTETSVSVYGKTITIIGQIENVTDARKAIESLLSGSQHASAFKWLERQRRKRTRMQFETRLAIGE